MNRIDTLKTLLEREENERDAVRLASERAQRDAEAAREQARQLTDYRSDYRAKWSERFTRGQSIEIVRHYQNYMGRLDQAVAQQDLVAARAEGQQQAAFARLREAETRVASVQKLIERRLHAERQAADRREQKAVDEAASRSRSNRFSAFGFAATTT